MNIDLKVDVHHLGRVEGHGNIHVRVEKGEVKEARWDVVETPRYFEVMLKGKDYNAAGILTARICGICSIGHCLASLRATEHALGVDIPPAAAKLRLLAKHGETLQSHVLHLFFLAAPDFFGLPNALALLDQETKAYDLARRVRGLADRLSETASAQPTTGPGRAIRSPAVRRDIERALIDLAAAVAPSVRGLPNARFFLEKRPEIFHMARRLKGLANRLCDVVAGRTTHPVSLQPGGVARMPTRAEFEELANGLHAAVDDLALTAELFRAFNIPPFVRETEFVSLGSDTEYPFIGGQLVSTDGVKRAENDYLAMTNEYVTAENTSKWTRLSRDAFAVGALARVNNNAHLLHPEAQKVAKLFGLAPVNHNPFMNNIAQLVESVHVTYEALRLIEELMAEPNAEIMVPIVPRAGEGVGAVEVPRGILYHHYQYDERGRIVKANCIIPTTQNNKNIHLDMAALAKQFAVEGMTDTELERLCSMLVRAYDPCVSCSVH